MITFKQHPLATHRRSLVPSRTAFTLVELLVALGLVSLLMLMFAQVFQVATGMMSTQRGVMENDQRARSITTVLKGDLDHLTMKSVMPFEPAETDYTLAPANAYYRFAAREGFLSISESETGNDTDDVLHFMATIPKTEGLEPFYGRALPLTNLAVDRNQPDADDGWRPGISSWTASSTYRVGDYVASTSTTYPLLDQIVFRCITRGTSGMSEPTWPTATGQVATDGSVTWIATNYSNQTAASSMAEIVYFLRNGNLYRRVMLIRDPLDDTDDPQPLDSAANNYFDYTLTAPRYPAGRDFWRDFDFSARFDASGTGAKFTNAATTGQFPIASPSNRFGHNSDPTHFHGSLPLRSIGNPREFLGTQFIGRFTQQETSDPDFNYPHSPSAFGTLGIPTDDVDTPAGTLNDTNQDGVIDEYADGPRRGEDIILTNVHAFDVKVWDEIVNNFVDVGYDPAAIGVNGDFSQNNNLRPSYGPSASNPNRMFDTWSPTFNANNDPPGVLVTPDADDRPPYIPRYSSSGHAWSANTVFRVGSVIIPSTPNGLAYQVTSVTGGSTSGASEPSWLTPVGTDVVDNEVTWTAIPNIKRLKSLKITIRYLDVTSDQMRQVTLIQSLLE